MLSHSDDKCKDKMELQRRLTTDRTTFRVPPASPPIKLGNINNNKKTPPTKLGNINKNPSIKWATLTMIRKHLQ